MNAQTRISEYVLGGELDMSKCIYEQSRRSTARITGPRFVPAKQLRVKLEGAGKIGERYVGMVGVRDPYTIAHIDDVIGWARGSRPASASAMSATSFTTPSTAATA